MKTSSSSCLVNMALLSTWSSFGRLERAPQASHLFQRLDLSLQYFQMSESSLLSITIGVNTITDTQETCSARVGYLFRGLDITFISLRDPLPCFLQIAFYDLDKGQVASVIDHGLPQVL